MYLFMAKIVNGLYVYEPEPFWGTINWDQLIPLFKILIPFLIVVGLPLFIVLIILVLVKSSRQGVRLTWNLFRAFKKEKKEDQDAKEYFMKNVSLIVIVAIVVILAVLTNPKQDQHKEVLKTKLNVFIQKAMKNSLTETDNEWEQVGQSLGLMIGGALINTMIDNMVSSDNYVLFSTTKIHVEGETRVIGIGAFGNIFFFKDIDALLNRTMNENTSE